MAGQLTKVTIGKEDLELQEDTGVATTFERTSSTGSEVTVTKFPDIWGYTGAIRPGDIISKGPWVDVRAHGADPTGVLDSTGAIQAAIDAINIANGGTVFVPKGSYLISSGLTIGDHTTFKGFTASYAGSGGTIIKLADNSNCDMITNKDTSSGNRYIKIEDVYFDGNSSNQTSGNGMAFTKLYDSTLQRLKFNNNKDNGIDFYSCQTNNILKIDMMNIGGNGIDFNTSSDNYIGEGCQITTSVGGGHGLNFTNSSDHNTITGIFVFTSNIGININAANYNIITNNRSNTNRARGIALTDASSNVVVGNRCYNNESALAGVRAGTYLSADSDDNTIVGNISRNEGTSNQLFGLRLDAGAENNTIVGNNLRNNASTGLYNLSTAYPNIIARNSQESGTPGEEFVAVGTLTAGVADAFAFAWQNPSTSKIIVTRVGVDVTTAGGAATSVLNVGSAASATTESDNLIDGADLNAVAFYDNIDDQGVNGKSKQKVDENAGTTDWVTGVIKVANASSLVGKYYIHYIIN